MSKICLHICFTVILALFVVNLNANPKPMADNGIDIIINRVGPMVGPRMLGLPKPGTGAGHWAMMPKNTRPKGQLISKCSFCVTKSTKKPTKLL